MAEQIQLRGDTAANWTSSNPILAQREVGLETDTNLFKVGNGTDHWNTLSYGGIQGGAGPTGPTGPAGTGGPNTIGGSNLGGVVGTTGVISGTALKFEFAGGNNITLSQSLNGATAGTITVVGQNFALSAANGSSTFQTATFANSNGVSFSTGTQGIYASVNAGGGVALYDGANSISSGTARFSNSNGVSFGFNGQNITGSVAAQTNQSLGLYATGNTTYNTSATYDARTLTVQGDGLVSVGYSNGSMVVSGGGAILYDGANAITSGSASFDDGGGVSFGINGNTITAAAGAALVPKRWEEILIRPQVTNVTNIASINGTPIFQPFFLDGALTLSRLNWEMSRATSGSNNFSVRAGIYSYVNDSQVALLATGSANFSNTATASVSGIRRFGLSGFSNVSTFAPGGYVLGMLFTAANTLSMNYSLRGGVTASPQLGAILPGSDQYNTATTYNIFPFFGRYTAASTNLPGTVNNGDVVGQFIGASQAINWWAGLNND